MIQITDQGEVPGLPFFVLRCHLTAFFTQRSGMGASPTSEETQLRDHLEYDEPDEPADVIHEVTEANVSIPNLPVPKSSDGDVRPLAHRQRGGSLTKKN